jgi:hypothetical protein
LFYASFAPEEKELYFDQDDLTSTSLQACGGRDLELLTA